jgi:hypothetical protein
LNHIIKVCIFLKINFIVVVLGVHCDIYKSSHNVVEFTPSIRFTYRDQLITLSKNLYPAGHWWLMPVIISFSEGRDKKDRFSKPAQASSSKDRILKKPIPKKGWWSGLRYRP